MKNKDKSNLKLSLLTKQKNKCCYCYNELNRKDKRLKPVFLKVEKKVCCFKCCVQKLGIAEFLYLQGYMNINHKYGYNLQSVNLPVKMRNSLRWYNKLFPKIFNWNNKRYNLTVKYYEESKHI